MGKIIELFLGCLIFWISLYSCGKILIKNEKYNKVIILIITILFSILLTILNSINYEIFYGIIKITSAYTLMCIYYCIVFNQTISKNVVTALAFYLCMFLSEIIAAILLSLLLPLFNIELASLKNTVLINVIVCSLAIILILKFKNILSRFISNIEKGKKGNIIIILIILLTMALLVFKIPVSFWKFNAEFVVTMIILFCFCIVALYLLKQQSDIQKTSTMYQQVVKYSKTTNKLLEDYRMVNHEHKNQLSVIRQMADKNNKQLIEYLDNLLDKKNIVKYQWISALNNLPSEGLKGLINYKLVVMENYGINPIVNISKEVSKLKINKLSTKKMDNLYSIVGIYLDNAIEAACKSKDKRITLDIYKEKKDLIIILGNTYKGKIDLERLDDYGYTTKGKNRGVGLHIVKNILDGNDTFSVKRSIVDNYYVQELKIDLNKLNKKR